MALRCPKCQTENPDTPRFCGECGTKLDISGARPEAGKGEAPPGLGEGISVTKTMETPTGEIATGTLFAGRYQVIEELGHGGMGLLYRALDQRVNEEVAIKIIRPEISSERKTLERLRNELGTARRISHRYVGRMYELMEDKGTYFITMEYVPGEDLRSAIRRFGQLPAGKSLTIAAQICEGLIEAHRLGVVHRDLKPSNIMIDKEGNARILDFGVARTFQEKGITGAGVMVGTPEYMSPEQVEGKEVDQRSDIHSLCVVLFEMVTGRTPFEGEAALSLVHKHRYEKPPNPRTLNAHLPSEFSRIILRCLEKKTAFRYQSAEELLEDLRKMEKGIPTTTRRAAKKPLTAREITVQLDLKKLILPLAALIILAVIGHIIWKAIPRKPAGPPPIQEKSVAVLPFVDLSPDRSFEHLADGITDALINALSRVRNLRVPARTSAFFFKGKE